MSVLCDGVRSDSMTINATAVCHTCQVVNQGSRESHAMRAWCRTHARNHLGHEVAYYNAARATVYVVPEEDSHEQ
jgi:hypothetical protein